MKAAFLTLGCKVNFYETEKMMEQFRDRGFEIVPFSEPADIYVINTCTVTNVADRKSRQMIHRAKKKNPNSVVVAVGCYVESGGEQLKNDPAIDVAFSNREKGAVADRMMEYFGWSEHHIKESEKQTAVYDFEHERTRAYIKIQDGCNQFCTYCLIPYVRGKGTLVSTPPEEVVRQVEALAKKGFQEIVLTGIHLSSYGVDGSDARSFIEGKGKPLIEVIRRAARIDGIRRIRLGSLEPRIISKEFLEELVTIPEVCPHFHLSLQSGCDTVLKRMNRHYTAAEYKECVELLRRYYENPAVTTDVIVGFPGETEDEFEQTRQYLEELRLSDIHVFKYSPRTGTKAAAMAAQVEPEVKNRRSDRLIADTERWRAEYCRNFLGKEEAVLFEEVVTEDGQAYLTGHNERYVKIGVLLEKAEKAGYTQNQIHTVTVEKVMKK